MKNPLAIINPLANIANHDAKSPIKTFAGFSERKLGASCEGFFFIICGDFQGGAQIQNYSSIAQRLFLGEEEKSFVRITRSKILGSFFLALIQWGKGGTTQESITA